MTCPRVLVFGDVMLDVLLTGTVKRMSPEAPDAPVVLQQDATYRPGGAANVAANITAMGGRAVLVGAIGADTEAQMLASILQHEVEDTHYLMRDVRTTTKIRIVADGKQMIRVDCEQPSPLSQKEIEQALPDLIKLVAGVSAVIISDYAKGVVAPGLAIMLIRAARDLEIPSIIDSKTPGAEHFWGAGVLKPNVHEIAAALGCDEPTTDAEASSCALELCGFGKANFVVLTRGEKGLCVAGAPGAMHIQAHKVQAIDVTGAGDAVAAGLALALARGDPIISAVHYANAAGAAVVTKLGTGGPSPEEIEFFYDRDAGDHQAHHPSVASSRIPNRLH